MDNHLALTRWHVATRIPDVFAFHFLLFLMTRKDAACVCVGRKSRKEVYKITNRVKKVKATIIHYFLQHKYKKNSGSIFVIGFCNEGLFHTDFN